MKTLPPFTILCGVGLLAIFSSTISKSPALPLYVGHLGGGATAVGMVAAVSALTGILCSFPAGILSDRLGRRRMLLFSTLVFGSAPFLYLAVHNIWQLALVRFYHGLATAIFLPVAMAMVSDLYLARRGEKMGWFSSASLVGRFAAPATGGAILAMHTLNGAAGFRWVYLLCGLAGLLTVAGALLLPADRPQPNPVRTQTGARGEVTKLLGQRGILVTCLVEAAILFAYGVFETFLPGHALAAGLTAWQLGLCLSSQVITVALAKPIMGRFSDRFGRPPQILAGAVGAGVTIILFPMAGSFVGLLALSVLLGVAISVVTSASAAHIADLGGQGAHGSAMGILGSIMDIGHTTGPLAGGLLAAALGPAASFIGAGAVLAAGSLIFAWKSTGLTHCQSKE